MSKITEYAKETKMELKHVVWPSKKQTMYFTLVVVILSVIVAYLLGAFDFAFLKGLEQILSF